MKTEKINEILARFADENDCELEVHETKRIEGKGCSLTYFTLTEPMSCGPAPMHYASVLSYDDNEEDLFFPDDIIGSGDFETFEDIEEYKTWYTQDGREAVIVDGLPR